MKELKAEIEISVRFNEVDSMGIVWHGSYAAYFEEAREEFGRQHSLGYLLMFSSGYYAPLVDLSFSYKRPLVYGDKLRVEVRYRPTNAAKIEFEYTIYSTKDNEVVTTGRSTQVFLDKDYVLQWCNPDFYEQWKRDNL